MLRNNKNFLLDAFYTDMWKTYFLGFLEMVKPFKPDDIFSTAVLVWAEGVFTCCFLLLQLSFYSEHLFFLVHDIASY